MVRDNGQSYWRTLIGSRVVSNGAILDDNGAHFDVKPGEDNLVAGKKALLEILALAEFCTL